ncbi:RNA polymerase sigma factor RpoE [bacterium BMS3Abin14]|nr:RNA polymerase sigma factor RpoE [bacterium BMS3Abin14]
MDDEHFQSEYGQVCDGLYTYLTRMAMDSEMAADVLQDAALKAYRAPFLLKHVEGMSYGQISEVLGIEEGAARVRVHRARHALVALLREV